MKVLHLNTYDLLGGASRAAYRLHRSLLEAGIESRMLVQYKSGDDWTVSGPEGDFARAIGFFRPGIERLLLKTRGVRPSRLFSPAWIPSLSVLEKIRAEKPDIVHLHWINGGMLRIEELAKIDVPVVWSLHDMWPFTGGCHYARGSCGKYLTVCGRCEVLGSTEEKDLSRAIFERKRRAFSKIDRLCVVGLSRWMYQEASRSALFENRMCRQLPNPIDLRLFKPVDRVTARRLWNLPEGKKLILFGSVDPLGDRRKGFAEFSEALSAMGGKEAIELVVFGSDAPRERYDFGFPTHYVGKLHDDVALTALYNAADVMVVPSLQENLSNAVMESLSCGTPVAAFGIGGNPDMIDHRRNGYLAAPFDAGDLAKGIEWILFAEKPERMREEAREKVRRAFDAASVARRWIELYGEVLGR